MIGPQVELQLEDLNIVPCCSIDLLLTYPDHIRFQVSTGIFLRIQLAKARLPLGATLRVGMSDKAPPHTKVQLCHPPQVTHLPFFQYVASVL